MTRDGTRLSGTHMWVPIVGPPIGGALAAYLYDYAVRDVLSRAAPSPTRGARPHR